MITTIKINKSWINVTNKIVTSKGSTIQSMSVYPNKGAFIDIGKYKPISVVYTPEYTVYTIERIK